MIRNAVLSDATQIVQIYNNYIRETVITFETEEITAQMMAQRIEEILSEGYPFYVYEQDGKILGYCYLSSWKRRCAYKASAEISIYLDVEKRSRGIGSQLMEYAHANFDKDKYHTILACITLPNDISVGLHEKFGYKKVSHFKEVGFKFNRWIDVGDWQVVL